MLPLSYLLSNMYGQNRERWGGGGGGGGKGGDNLNLQHFRFMINTALLGRGEVCIAGW